MRLNYVLKQRALCGGGRGLQMGARDLWVVGTNKEKAG